MLMISKEVKVEVNITALRILTIKFGLETEIRTNGRMRLSAKIPKCTTIVRREFGLKGNRRKLYKQFCELQGLEPKPEYLPE